MQGFSNYANISSKRYVPAKDGYLRFSKRFGRALSSHTFIHGLRTFFLTPNIIGLDSDDEPVTCFPPNSSTGLDDDDRSSNSSLNTCSYSRSNNNNNNGVVAKWVLKEILDQLKGLMHALEQLPECRLYGSSLLIVYDHVPCVFSDEVIDGNTKFHGFVKVKLIDFAHSHFEQTQHAFEKKNTLEGGFNANSDNYNHNDDEDKDNSSFMFGIRHLVNIFSLLLEER